MKKDQTLMTFPCDFQIKIIGKNSKTFAEEIIGIARKHFPDVADTAIQSQLSQEGNYMAISINLIVKDQLTLDSLYMELTKHPDIKMVL
jgi:putative lipoic acid-binding regulatory protein